LQRDVFHLLGPAERQPDPVRWLTHDRRLAAPARDQAFIPQDRQRDSEMLGYGLTKTKFLVLSGQIRSVKDGAYRRILPEWVDEYIRRLAEEQAR
jgi:hypothetical protein